VLPKAVTSGADGVDNDDSKSVENVDENDAED
jgi:hypothetical protein